MMNHPKSTKEMKVIVHSNIPHYSHNIEQFIPSSHRLHMYMVVAYLQKKLNSQ